MKLKEFFTKPCVLIIVSAILSALPLTFSQLFFISWVSFIPLFYIVINRSSDKFRFALGRGFLFGFIYHLCIYYWFLLFYCVVVFGVCGCCIHSTLLGFRAVHR